MTNLRRAWLEPGRTDPEAGLRAEVADPVWFLARQWELGEFQGEDASSPVRVTLTPQQVPLRYDTTRPHLDPIVIPGEALIEAEPGDWWTIGRRARAGTAVAPLLGADDVDGFRFGPLPAPYEELSEAVDGRAVFVAGVLAGHAVWRDLGVPSPPPDRFSRRDLSYTAAFSAGDTGLEVREHRGGDVDWFSVEVGEAPPVPAAAATPPMAAEVVPTRLTFPGAPHPRWWQIEDMAVDLGAFAPDRSHLATMLLSDLAVADAEDWFVFPVPAASDPVNGIAPPTAGVLASLGTVVRVVDSFGEEHDLAAPPPAEWSLYFVKGLTATDLVVWPVAVAAHGGPTLDDIVIGVDEDANLVWAAELRADGAELLADTASGDAIAETTRTGTRQFRYTPMTTLPPHWHPYTREEQGAGAPEQVWRQAILADLTGPVPKPRPGPVSRLIGGPSGDGAGSGHELDLRAVPSAGVRVQRRARLARDTNGAPVLWVERSAVPVAGPPVSHLRWDVMVEASKPEPNP